MGRQGQAETGVEEDQMDPNHQTRVRTRATEGSETRKGDAIIRDAKGQEGMTRAVDRMEDLVGGETPTHRDPTIRTRHNLVTIM